MVQNSNNEHSQTHEFWDDENSFGGWEIENDEANVKNERIQRKDNAVDSSFCFFQGDQKAQESVELSDDQEKDGICDQNQAGQHEVGLTEVPLFQNLKCY